MENEINYTTWIATDDLGRTTPINSETGDRKENKYVGLFYFIWHRDHSGKTIIDHTKEYIERGLDGFKDFLSKPHATPSYWAEPYFGYYVSSDEWIYRKHAYMLSAAGIDFIYLDFTNGVTFPNYFTLLLDTWIKIREEGGNTPRIVCHTGEFPHFIVTELYSTLWAFYKNPKYTDLWFKWEGKPLIFGNLPTVEYTVDETIGSYSQKQFFEGLERVEGATEFYLKGEFDNVISNFTVRRSWAIVSGKDIRKGYWNWLDNSFPQKSGIDFNGKEEQMPVAMGILANLSQGRSYMGKRYGKGIEDFEFSLGTAKYGYLFEHQFKNAIEKNPDVIMITGWNEWIAGRIETDRENEVVANTNTPYYRFVDQFNPEFSRDGEPMKLRDGVGYGDNYYYQMVSLIRIYKGTEKIEKAYGKITDMYDEAQWDSVGPEYRDTIKDTTIRDCESWGGVYRYINYSGRNDLKYAKVSSDNENIYFYITTVNDIIEADDTSWMNLFIDIDMNHNTGWEGYDYILNRSRDRKYVSVERFIDNSWKFEKVGKAEYYIGKKSLTIKVNKTLLQYKEDDSFDFKWADHSTVNGNILEFMDLGDTAPNDRFNFRYSTK